MRAETPEGALGQLLWEEKATDAALAFLRDTKVGCIVARRPPEEEGDSEGAEGEPGPP